MRYIAAGSICLTIGFGLTVAITALTTLTSHTPWWSPPLALAGMVGMLWWGIWAVNRLKGRGGRCQVCDWPVLAPGGIYCEQCRLDPPPQHRT